MSIILKAENISKQYRLGTVGTGTLSHDITRWWASLRGKEDPFLKIGAVNDRRAKATQDYVWALQDINFEIRTGELLGIIGKNGAGKSTLLKILSRVTSPTTGNIKTKGRIASLLEVGTGFHGELSGRENIFMNGTVLGMSKNEIKRKLDEIIEFSGCEMYIDTPVKRYSSGMTVRLGFAVAAHLEPEILVVDEVLAVGDAEFQRKAIGKMNYLSQGEGRTVLFVSHNMASIRNLCSKTILLENGTIEMMGDTNAVVNSYLADFKSISRGNAVISDKNRRFNTTREIEILEVSLINDICTTRESLKFQISLKKNLEMNGLFCLTGTIHTNQEEQIGSFFSPSFKLLDKISIITLNIEGHNLAVGEYYLNFSVSKGENIDSNLTVIDHAYEAIGFDVIKETRDLDYIMYWNNNWGNLFFKSNVKIKN